MAGDVPTVQVAKHRAKGSHAQITQARKFPSGTLGETMQLRRQIMQAGLLASALAGMIILSGCSAHVRCYDEYGGDYHTWNGYEVWRYHVYWNERHEPYREYPSLNKEEQADIGSGGISIRTEVGGG
jgi:hypothetical protein